jgi:hypothetical protein
MSFTIDHEWKACFLKLGDGMVKAYRRRASGDVNIDHPFIEEHLISLIREQAVLVRHLHDAHIVEEIVNTGGITGYKLASLTADFWYLPKCSYEQSLGLLETFGFPSPKVCSLSTEVRRLAQGLLLELGQTRTLALLTVASDIVFVKRVEGSDFTTEEITLILEYNQAHFGMEYSKTEFMDLRRLYRRKGFFILGCM